MRRRPSRGALLLALGASGLVALLVAVDPRSVGAAIGRVGPGAVPWLLALTVGYYLLQAVRWQLLLRAAGIRLRTGTTVLLSIAGQATGLLPAGEVARVALVSDATGAPFASVLATVTVQELLYTLLLVALAVPASLDHPALAAAVLVALAGTCLVILLLCTKALWRPVRWAVGRLPLLRRLAREIDVLQANADTLLRRPDTAWWSVLGLLGALDAVTLFWLVVHLLAPGAINWETAAFIYGISHVAGALSAIPGGLGAYEGSVVGLLIAAGVDPATAAAAALLHRAADKGVMTLVGVVALAASRRVLGTGGSPRPAPADAV